MSDLHVLIHMIATDTDFRAELLSSPHMAISQSGLSVSNEELGALLGAIHLLAFPTPELQSMLDAVLGELDPWRGLPLTTHAVL